MGAQAQHRHPDKGGAVSSKPNKLMALGGRKPLFHTDTGWSVHSVWYGIFTSLSHETATGEIVYWVASPFECEVRNKENEAKYYSAQPPLPLAFIPLPCHPIPAPLLTPLL